MKKWILIPAAILAVLMGGLIVLALVMVPRMNPEGEKGKDRKPGSSWSLFGGGGTGKEVRVIEAALGEVVATVSAPGIITPAREVAISSRLPGRIMELFVDEGFPVEKGQIIARLETKDFENALERVQSDRQIAEARMEEARASLEQAQVASARSEADLERKETLYERGAFSDTEIDQARNQADRDRLAETIATKNVREAEEALRAARLSEDRARRDLDETEIRSPLTGTVTARNVNVGERVILGIAGDPSSALFVISDLSEILVYANVDEMDVGKVAAGQPAEVEIEAIQDKVFQGETIDVAPRASRQGEISTFRTRIRVEAEGETLLPGMSAQVDIEVERAADTLVVPLESVVERKVEEGDEEEEKPEEDDGEEEETKYRQVVYVLEDGVAREREVKTGILDGKRTQILEGIEEGEIVISGPYRVLDDLKDGDEVRVKESGGEEKPPQKEGP